MDSSLPRATLLYTEVRSFHSTIMGDEYQISTWFPPDYPHSGQIYPVIYLLDPELNLGLVSSLVLGAIWDHALPTCLIVGVGHDVSTYDEWYRARSIDYTPEEDPDITPPKRAADFLSFLKTELIPLIEATYPVDPANRCLAGYSGGGEFTLYALLHEPDLFQRYFIASAIWENMFPHYLAYEQRLADRRTSLPVRALFSVGSLEADQVPWFHQFLDVLNQRQYDDLCLETLVVEGETHATAGAVAWSQGLRTLYRP